MFLTFLDLTHFLMNAPCNGITDELIDIYLLLVFFFAGKETSFSSAFDQDDLQIAGRTRFFKQQTT